MQYREEQVSVFNPSHYRTDGPECIDVVRHMPYSQGNAIKYLWRAGMKGDTDQDLTQALWYVQDCQKSAVVPGDIPPILQDYIQTTNTYRYEAIWQIANGLWIDAVQTIEAAMDGALDNAYWI